MANSQANVFLRRAAELALQGRFRVEPNPLVGCVLVKKGRVVGEGAHRTFGGPHAERVALDAAGRRARGATAYVTLEPCDHHGKTPPCTDALVRAGVAEVVYAHPDRSGSKVLRKAGIRVRRARTPAVVREQLRPFLRHRGRRRPWVIAKWAMTLDGRIASRRGDSHWITASETRRWSHREFRGRVGAIVVGAGTILADDPALTNRSRRGGQPLRVVVCGRRRLWPRARVLTDGGPTLLAVASQYRAPAGVETLECGRVWRVEPRRLARKLHDRGVERVLVEGGGELLGSFFDAGLVDQVLVFLGPRVVGGITAIQAVGGKGIARMTDALELDHPIHRTIGTDHVFEGYVRRES